MLGAGLLGPLICSTHHANQLKTTKTAGCRAGKNKCKKNEKRLASGTPSAKVMVSWKELAV
jgi:hypothetical protein